MVSPAMYMAVGTNKLKKIVPQEAWIMSGTIRDNITFGAAAKDIDNEGLWRVVEACGLAVDIASMGASLEWVLSFQLEMALGRRVDS